MYCPVRIGALIFDCTRAAQIKYRVSVMPQVQNRFGQHFMDVYFFFILIKTKKSFQLIWETKKNILLNIFIYLRLIEEIIFVSHRKKINKNKRAERDTIL